MKASKNNVFMSLNLHIGTFYIQKNIFVKWDKQIKVFISVL